MSTPLVYNLSESQTISEEFDLRARIAIDRAPIAQIRKLDIGFDITSFPGSYLSPPSSISPVSRALAARIDSTIDKEPFIITDLAYKGPDADFTLSITSISTIATALTSNEPLAMPIFKIEDLFYIDEQIHNEYNPLSALFKEIGAPISKTSAIDITNLSLIASHAIQNAKEDKWFGRLKDTLEISERVNQRFYRETEKLLPTFREHFSRSFECTALGITLNVGTNSILCSIDNEDPCILEYSMNEPSPTLLNQWYMEALLSDCPRILQTSSSGGKITKFEIVQAPVTAGMEHTFRFLKEIKEKITNDGTYLLYKQANSKQIYVIQPSNDHIRLSGIRDILEYKIAMLQMYIGFRTSLSTNESIVEVAQRHLLMAAQTLPFLEQSLCFERISDSTILPVLLLDRYHSLIWKPLQNKEIPDKSYEEAINIYELALSINDIPDKLKLSLKQKIASVSLAYARSSKKDEMAEKAITIAKDLPDSNEFIMQSYIWRGMNAIEQGNIDSATEFANKAKEYRKDENSDIKKLESHILNTRGQLLESSGDIEGARRSFTKAKYLFLEIKDLEDAALCDANIGHIERRIAIQLQTANNSKFTVEEENHLNKSRLLYSDALKNVSQSHKNHIIIDICSLYLHILIRLTQNPPLDRMKPQKVEELADTTIKALKTVIAAIEDRTSQENQSAALDVWSGRFDANVRLPLAKSEKAKSQIYQNAINSLIKARKFFIADNYPADFISITLTLVNCYLSNGDFKNSLIELTKSLEVIRPRSIVLPNVLPETAHKHELIQRMLPELVTVTRDVLKSTLKEMMSKNMNVDKMKALYAMSLKATPQNIADTIEKIAETSL